MNIELGFSYLRSHQFDQAKYVADSLLETNPNNHGALNLSALVAQQQGDLDNAINQLQKAINIHDSEPIYYSNLGDIYRQSHRYSEAIQASQTALNLKPDYTKALINLGSSYFAIEQYKDAAVAYRRVVELNPTQGIYYAYLADTLRQLGRISAAIQTYQDGLALLPDSSYIIGNLGLTLLQIGQPQQALDYCSQATKYEPDHSKNWMNLGTVHRILGALEEAMEAYGKAYELNSQSAQICTLIGQIWEEVDDLEQATLWFDQALAIEPERLETRSAWAEAMLNRGKIQSATKAFREICDQHPDYCPAYLGLSKALWDDGNMEEAIAIAHQAVELRPEDAQLKTHLATVLASAGDVETANIFNREALAVNPRCVVALANLAQNLRKELPEADVKWMEQLIAEDWTHEEAKSSLHFGLAYYYDSCGNYAQASSHCLKANELHTAHKQARGWNYQPENYVSYIDQVMSHFDADFFQRTQGMGNPSSVPVFVVGMPRSGTTLTEQILACHPHVFGVGERNFASRGLNSLPLHMGCEKGSSLWSVFDQIESSHISHRADWHLDCLKKLAIKAGLEPQDYQRVVDKMPENYSFLGWIITLFPNAKIIHCRRNVFDVALSCWMTQFKAVRWAFNLVHIAERIKQYRRIMDHWRAVLPASILDIDYEETVADQAGQTEKLLDFLGLEWDDACLKFYKSDRLVRTASITQVRQPIYQRSVERWRNYETMLAPLKELIEK
ncbi:MAG: sulfotransferase [Leptolyngbyaceae bacterium]|nr:sulfotransferase [Leptolyngbyaceae bacterium]